MSGPVVWVLVHRLDGGGVPAVLVRYLRWLRAEHGAAGDGPAVHVVAGGGGAQVAAIGALADTCTLLGPATGRSRAATVAAAAAQLGHPEPGARWADAAVRRRLRSLPAPDAVVVHGAGGWPLWRAVAPLAGGCRLVLHLHELTVGISRSVPEAERAAMAAEPDAIGAVCAPDAGLTALLGARADEVALVPGCADEPGAIGAGPGAAAADEGRPQVVAVGEAGWRKGADRFEALGHELARRSPGAVLRWIGSPPPAGWSLAVGTPSPVRWEGPSAEPWASVPRSAVVVLPSREDPLPLASLEAGARGLAVVGSGTGGLAALLDGGRGWFVGSSSIGALADDVAGALADPDEARRRGAALQGHVAAHLAAGVVGPRWWALVTGRPLPHR